MVAVGSGHSLAAGRGQLATLLALTSLLLSLAALPLSVVALVPRAGGGKAGLRCEGEYPYTICREHIGLLVISGFIMLGLVSCAHFANPRDVKLIDQLAKPPSSFYKMFMLS